MSPNYLDFAKSAALMPLRVLGLARTLLGQISQPGAVVQVPGHAYAVQ